MQPKLRRHREVANAIGVGYLVGGVRDVQEHVEELVVISARPIHHGQACRQAPARVDLVGQRHVKEIDVIHHLRMLGFALCLLRGTDEMAERMLITVTGRNRPMTRRERVVIFRELRLLGIRCTAQRAKHGRARPCGHSTLAPSPQRNHHQQHEQCDSTQLRPTYQWPALSVAMMVGPGSRTHNNVFVLARGATGPVA
jgi:hypothetical protein